MIRNATIDLNSRDTYPPNRFSRIPKIYPPNAAPTNVVIPPRTAAAKPFRSGSSIRFGSKVAMGANNIPATAPIMELNAQVRDNILFVRMPLMRAAMAFCWVAFIAIPTLVYLKKRKSINIKKSVIRSVAIFR